MKYQCAAKFESYLNNRVYPIRDALRKIIVSQVEAVDTCVMGLFSVGQRDFNVDTKQRILGCSHILLCGATGSGKTVLVKAVSTILGGSNKRVSGIPDAQPSDISGSEMILLDSSKHVHHGPAFSANILLADEINRFSPKAQNAFIEMLAEQQITIGDITYKLKNPFICIATINPSEQNKGTAQISEALSDRFVYKVLMSSTSVDEKVEVARRTHRFQLEDLKQIMTLDEVNEAREYFFDSIYIDDKVRYYCARLLNAINGQDGDDLFKEEKAILDGISIFKQSPPANDRCMLHLENASMANAMFCGREFVTPRDVMTVAHRVLRGRLLLNPVASPVLLAELPQFQQESGLIDYLISKVIKGTNV